MYNGSPQRNRLSLRSVNVQQYVRTKLARPYAADTYRVSRARGDNVVPDAVSYVRSAFVEAKCVIPVGVDM